MGSGGSRLVLRRWVRAGEEGGRGDEEGIEGSEDAVMLTVGLSRKDGRRINRARDDWTAGELDDSR